MFIYLFLRERETTCGGGTETETESDSTEPDEGLKLRNSEIMTWAEVGRLSNWATQEPLKAIGF